MEAIAQLTKQYLIASDFDQTLSFHDSGAVLSEVAGIPKEEFEKKVAILAIQNFVQQGAELPYLLLHDPEYHTRVVKEQLIEAGKRVRLKKNILHLRELVAKEIEGYQFDFHVLSAAPQEVVESALEGVVPANRIHGTQLLYDDTGHVEGIVRINAGYGKVSVLDDLQAELRLGADRIIYVGDGSSDIHVMLHVNRREGFTIAVSESRHIATIAKRTVLSDDALSLLVPIFEDIVGWSAAQIRAFFEAHGLVIQDWDKVRADWLTIERNHPPQVPEARSAADGAPS